MLTALKKIFGTKSERDIKSLQPIVDQINALEQNIRLLSNDELRAKTTAFKEKIKKHVLEEEQQILQLTEKAGLTETPVEEKIDIYDQIDKLTDQIYKKSQDILDEILPEAFAVVRETARRFKNNQVIEVTASEFDKALATKTNSVSIKGDKAFTKTPGRPVATSLHGICTL